MKVGVVGRPLGAPSAPGGTVPAGRAEEGVPPEPTEEPVPGVPTLEGEPATVVPFADPPAPLDEPVPAEPGAGDEPEPALWAPLPLPGLAPRAAIWDAAFWMPATAAALSAGLELGLLKSELHQEETACQADTASLHSSDASVEAAPPMSPFSTCPRTPVIPVGCAPLFW
jgi:hypothetical protein